MTDRKTHLDGVAVASLLVCCVVWGVGHVASKAALAEWPPITQVATRSLGAAALVLLWSWWRGIALFQRDGTLVGGLAAATLFGLEFALIFGGLQYTNASRMAVFIYLSPFVVALGMPFIARTERLDTLQIVGLVAAFAGVAWAFAEGFGRPSAGDRQWIGDAMGVGGAVLWGATTLVIRATRLSTASAEKTLLYQLAGSGVGLALGAWAIGERWPVQVSPLGWGLMAFQTVVVCFITYLMWFWLMRHYPATRIASFTLLTPVAGLLAGVLLLDEPLTVRLVVALVAVAAGIALVNRLGRSPVSAPPVMSPPRQADPQGKA